MLFFFNVSHCMKESMAKSQKRFQYSHNPIQFVCNQYILEWVKYILIDDNYHAPGTFNLIYVVINQ